MNELSVFVDESGVQEGNTPYYLVTLVLHDQNEEIGNNIRNYEEHLSAASLPDIPFHSTPLLRGNEAYRSLSSQQRKQLLVNFSTFTRKLPIQYVTFSYESKIFKSQEVLTRLVRKDLANFIYEHYEFLCSFETIKIFYNDGQRAVSHAMKESFKYMLSRESLLFPKTDYRKYRLAQVADYICSIELAAIKYQNGMHTFTDERFYGKNEAFHKNFYKKISKKRLSMA